MTITAEEVKAAMGDYATQFTAMKEVADDVTDATGVSLAEMREKNRRAYRSSARQLFMFKAYQAGFSYPMIGEFINRDHTTVMHGVKKVEQAMEKQND